MNPIKIENIDNIADIYILRRKMNKSMIYSFVPLFLILISVALFVLFTAMFGVENSNIETIFDTPFLMILFGLSFFLFIVAIVLSTVLWIVVTINAMNRAIAFFTFINDQQYLKKSKFQKKIFIFQLFLPIFFFIPFIRYVPMIIQLINFIAWRSIKNKLNVIEFEFFKRVSK
jgi:hypothetical protein